MRGRETPSVGIFDKTQNSMFWLLFQPTRQSLGRSRVGLSYVFQMRR